MFSSDHPFIRHDAYHMREESMNILLVNAPLQSIVCDRGVGHQTPLGLLMIGGPLLDHGYTVRLLDAARHHLSDAEIVQAVEASAADVVMIAHVGSTSAHPCCLRVLHAIKAAHPSIITVYGGVHPTYHDRAILTQAPQVDIIVRGEGEQTTVALMNCLAQQRLERDDGYELAGIEGVSWRRGGEIVRNPARQPIEDLDGYRIAWELIHDWDCYHAFGLGRAAVVQFSRGCPHYCTYCGQWMFWKRWRHRSVQSFVDELQWLHEQYNIQFFWLADENPTTLKDVWSSVLQEIAQRHLSIGLCASIRAQDIVRDADILHLYQQAGFLYVLMGVETVTDETMSKIRKDSSVDDAYQAVRLLRQHHILSIVDYIFGLEHETPRTLWRGLRGLHRYDGDFLNALYLTPHAWTPMGQQLKDAPLHETDLWKWDYRHQILSISTLSPTQLFCAVKLVECVYHLHPRRLGRLFTAHNPHVRKLLRFSFWHITLTFWSEIFHFIASRRG
jgi:anaerobic magnesium-protoporphyrin IX monomethyl ester cyclase